MKSDLQILIAGEALIDLLPLSDCYIASVGGSPLNVACVLGRLGAATSLASAIGNDGFAGAIRERLSWAGVSSGALQEVAYPSSLAVVHFSEDQPQYRFYIQGTCTEQFSFSQMVEPTNYTHIHFGSYLPCAPLFADASWQWVEALPDTISRSIDLNVRLELTPDASRVVQCIERLCGHFDLIKASDEDLALLYPDHNQQQLVQHWLDKGAGLVVITQGAEGSRLYSKQHCIDAPVVKIDKVVDTVGCGDAFMAGMLHMLTARMDVTAPRSWGQAQAATLLEAMTFSARLAAYNCTQKGASSPTLEQLNAWCNL